MAFVPVEEAIEVFRRGGMVILVDDETRENEGDLAIAAEHISPQAILFMIRHGGGLICAPIVGQRLDELRIPLMVQEGESSALFGTAFTVSVDYRHGTTSGVSAQDRAATVRALLDPRTRPEDLARPGHVFPLRYREGGVLVRSGHTEASVDLARLAGLYPAAVICEVLGPDGAPARGEVLQAFAARHRIPMLSITALIAYRRRHERLVERTAEAHLPTPFGVFRAMLYRNRVDGREHLALVLGDPASSPTLVRVHDECLTGDVLGSLRCDCGEQLRQAMRLIGEHGQGVLIYLAQEGRGIGLTNKIRAYALQEQGWDTVEANRRLGLLPDARAHWVAAQILRDLGIRQVRLLTNNPQKIQALEEGGIRVVERIPLRAPETPENRLYLRAKRERLGHWL